MANINDAEISSILLAEQGSDPAIPAAGHWHFYVKSGGLYARSPAGTIYGPLAQATVPGAHKTQHENGGSDEISVAGLSGTLADAQTPADHAHSGTGTSKLAQANTHESPDTDVATISLHHTLGTGANQAAAGDHGHSVEGAALLSSGPITDGWRLAADGAGGAEWVAPAAIPANLDDLADVNAPTPTNGDVLTWDSTPGEWVNAAPSGGTGHTIQDEGTPMTARTNLNFVGAGVAVTDDAGNNATIVTIGGGGGVDILAVQVFS